MTPGVVESVVNSSARPCVAGSFLWHGQLAHDVRYAERIGGTSPMSICDSIRQVGEDSTLSPRSAGIFDVGQLCQAHGRAARATKESRFPARAPPPAGLARHARIITPIKPPCRIDCARIADRQPPCRQSQSMPSSASHEYGVQGSGTEANERWSCSGPIPSARNCPDTRRCQKQSGSIESNKIGLPNATSNISPTKSANPIRGSRIEFGFAIADNAIGVYSANEPRLRQPGELWDAGAYRTRGRRASPYHGRPARADGAAVEELRFCQSQRTVHGRDGRDTGRTCRSTSFQS